MVNTRINQEDVYKRQVIGKELYFGRVLGKYSEIYGIFELKDIEEINLSDAAIEELLHTVGKTVCGYNPLEYVQSVSYTHLDVYKRQVSTYCRNKNVYNGRFRIELQGQEDWKTDMSKVKVLMKNM